MPSILSKWCDATQYYYHRTEIGRAAPLKMDRNDEEIFNEGRTSHYEWLLPAPDRR